MESLTRGIGKLYQSRQFHLLAAALIIVLTLVAYSNSFTASFHFDDDASINENPTIKQVTIDNIITQLRTNRPVMSLSLMFNYAVSGMNVVGWHIFNISFHIANSILVYFFLLGTLTLPAFHNRYADRAKRMALFGSLLFALHPIQTESVTYIISRSELLAAFFFLVTFLLFIEGVRKERFSYFICAFLMSLLAIASKEWAATLPAMLLVYDYFFLSQGSSKALFTRWKAYTLMFLPWVFAIYILSLYKGVTSAGFSMSGTNGITPITYLLTSFNVVWTYIRLLILPINQNLDYDYHLAKTLFEFPTLLSFMGHLIVLGAAFWTYKKKGWLLAPFGVVWFYLVLSPTQSFVPILDLIFEHRLYMPSLGLFLAFIVGYEAFFDLIGEKQRPQIQVNQNKKIN